MMEKRKGNNRIRAFLDLTTKDGLREYLFGYSSLIQNIGDIVTYKNLRTLRKTIQTKKWRLGSPLLMNDKKELSDFPRADWNHIFYSCFMANTSESIAMWSMYGRPWADGISITIPNKVFAKWVRECRTLYYLHDGEYKKLPNAELSIVRIAYTNELTKAAKEPFQLICGDQKNKNIKEIFENEYSDYYEYCDPTVFSGAIKDIAWAYENELRIRADVTANTGKLDAVYIDVPDYVLDNLIITAGPMFCGNLEYRLGELFNRKLELRYSRFSRSLQGMPCTDYTKISGSSTICPERQSLYLDMNDIPVADHIMLYSNTGKGDFLFLKDGCFEIGDEEYRFAVYWRKEGTNIILEHQVGVSSYATSIPSAKSLYWFQFSKVKEYIVQQDPVLIINEYGRVAAICIKPSFFEPGTSYYEMEYKIYPGVRISLYSVDEYNDHYEKQDEEKSDDPLCSTWWDMNSQRCHMDIREKLGRYFITIDWASSASMNSEWTMSGTWDRERKEICCADEASTITIFNDYGIVEVITEYENGSSRLFMKEDNLYWEDAENDTGYRCKFSKMEK